VGLTTVEESEELLAEFVGVCHRGLDALTGWPDLTQGQFCQGVFGLASLLCLPLVSLRFLAIDVDADE
jgi:hypothetical protein